jgi:hypothetical protein
VRLRMAPAVFGASRATRTIVRSTDRPEQAWIHHIRPRETAEKLADRFAERDLLRPRLVKEQWSTGRGMSNCPP